MLSKKRRRYRPEQLLGRAGALDFERQEKFAQVWENVVRQGRAAPGPPPARLTLPELLDGR